MNQTGQQEDRKIWEALDRLPAHDPPQSLWPLVRRRLQARRARRRPLLMAVSTTMAAAGGIVLGILLGSGEGPASGAWQQETWSEVGSLLADGGNLTLDEVYFLETNPTEEVEEP
jgi:hypothetical protein